MIRKASLISEYFHMSLSILCNTAKDLMSKVLVKKTIGDLAITTLTQHPHFSNHFHPTAHSLRADEPHSRLLDKLSSKRACPIYSINCRADGPHSRLLDKLSSRQACPIYSINYRVDEPISFTR